MSSTPPCQRCHALTETRSHGAGLWLCQRCPLRPFCGEYKHTYRARDGMGALICIDCATTLTSQPITTDIVAADQTTLSAEED
jgi:ribosomal protein L37AE/L43A